MIYVTRRSYLLMDCNYFSDSSWIPVSFTSGVISSSSLISEKKSYDKNAILRKIEEWFWCDVRLMKYMADSMRKVDTTIYNALSA